MISLRKYLLDGPREDSGDDFIRVLRLLFQGIRLHAVEGDRGDYEDFRADIERLERSLSGEPSAAQLCFLARSVVKALGEYNQRTTRFVRIHAVELQAMIAMLTETIAAISAANERSVSRLQNIEHEIEKASMIEDFRAVKIRLGECLTGLREETLRQREESARTICEMNEALENTRTRTAAAPIPPATDPVTGLPQRAEAERLLASIIESRASAFAGVFLVERLQSINLRFGYAVGDHVLVSFAQMLAQKLPAADPVFRWSGPAFVAVLQREEPLEKIRAEIARIILPRLEKTVHFGYRTVLLPISATWTVLPMLPAPSLLFNRIDSFLASQSLRETP